ncbi:MAG: hypothetical protein ACK6D2_07320 [Planctomycetota bacterium]
MIPASGPARVSGLVRALWAELTKPADELDLAAIDAAVEGAVAAQAAACDASGMLFGHKSHQGKPPKAGPWRPRSWHEVPLLVALAAMPAGVGWRERLAELVAQFGPGLDEGLEIELERAEKRTPRPQRNSAYPTAAFAARLLGDACAKRSRRSSCASAARPPRLPGLPVAEEIRESRKSHPAQALARAARQADRRKAPPDFRLGPW